MHWVTRIQHALDEDRFCLYAQMIEPLEKSSGKHFEVLVRMIDEEGDIIPPGAFLPSAERYNLMRELDKWVISDTLRSLKTHPEFLNRIDFISINLSGQSITDERFLEFVLKEIRSLKSSATKICFEITETAAISNLLLAGKFISELRRFGCRFALDDFGSGLSSFGYLKNLAVDYLKIDGTFVKDIVCDPIDRAMVKSINEIGQVMGMETIAEFVESEEIKTMLKEIGVNYAQGFAIHKPQPFIELLTEESDTKDSNSSKVQPHTK
jgi:EAL domain-containing protein (putative c-di-GMP-specific phosphodiesterase class I)